MGLYKNFNFNRIDLILIDFGVKIVVRLLFIYIKI